MQLHCANMAERIEVLFGVETYGDPKNIRWGCDFLHGFEAAFAKLLWHLLELVHSGSISHFFFDFGSISSGSPKFF